MFLWGGFAYLAFMVPSTLAGEIAKTIRSSSKLLAIVLFCATLVTLPIQSAHLGDGWTDAFNGEILKGMLLESGIGPSWFAQAAMASFVACAVMLAPQRLRLLACLAGLFVATRLLIGHAVMLDGTNELILRLSYLTHLVAAGAWIGALVPVFLIMWQMTDQPTADQTTALRRFSIAGHGAVALTVISGAVNGVLIRGRFSFNPASAYDSMLAAKIAIVATMILIAIINRYLIVPRLRANANAVLALRALTATEFLLALLVLVLVNLFSTLNPH